MSRFPEEDADIAVNIRTESGNDGENAPSSDRRILTPARLRPIKACHHSINLDAVRRIFVIQSLRRNLGVARPRISLGELNYRLLSAKWRNLLWARRESAAPHPQEG